MALIDPRVTDHTYRLICRACQRVLTDAACACNALHGYLYGDPADFPGHVCKPVAPPAAAPDRTRAKSDQTDALHAIAAWLVAQGYPCDYRATSEPPPAALWEAIVDVVHLDADGTLHGNELTRDEVDSWLRGEAGLPQPDQEGTQ